jgi:hypothetical protein
MRRIRERFGFFYVPSDVARETFDVVLRNALGTGDIPLPIDIPLIADAERVLDDGLLRIIGDKKEDRGIIASVKTMPEQLKKLIDGAYAAKKFLKDYNDSQVRVWMPMCKHFLGERLGREPSQDEWITDCTSNGSIVDHKVYFVMRFPEKLIRVADGITDRFRERILAAA